MKICWRWFNAGLIPATVTTTERANLWTQVLPDVSERIRSWLSVREGQLAWAIRKDNSQLKALLDEFITTRAVGNVVRQYGDTAVSAER